MADIGKAIERTPVAVPSVRPPGSVGQHRAAAGAETDAQVLVRSWSDPEAFGEIYRRHYQALLRHILRRVGHQHGLDITAEVFAQAFAGRYRYRREYPSARPWLFGIAANLCRKHYRTSRRAVRAYRRVAAIDPGYVTDPASQADARICAGAAAPDLARGLRLLREQDRAVLIARAVHDFSYREIAEAIGIPVGTVRSRLARARLRIRRAVETAALDLHAD